MHDALGTLRDVLGSLPHLQWWITGAWLLYLVPLCAWIVLQKREPVATLSWLLSLALLPYVGYLIYFLLGPQRIKRHQLRRTRSREGVESYEVFAPSDGNSAELPMLAQKTTGLPPATATSVQQLVDGCATYRAILDAIARCGGNKKLAAQELGVEHGIIPEMKRAPALSRPPGHGRNEIHG